MFLEEGCGAHGQHNEANLLMPLVFFSPLAGPKQASCLRCGWHAVRINIRNTVFLPLPTRKTTCSTEPTDSTPWRRGERDKFLQDDAYDCVNGFHVLKLRCHAMLAVPVWEFIWHASLFIPAPHLLFLVRIRVRLLRRSNGSGTARPM